MTEVEASLETFLTCVSTSSRNQRKEIFENVLHPLVSDPEADLADAYASIASALISTIPTYVDKPSRSLVEEAVALLFQHHKGFVKHFLKLLKQRSQACVKCGADSSVLGLLRWVSKSIQHLEKNSMLNDAAFSELSSIQFTLLQRLYSASPALVAPSVSAVASVLLAHPQLRERYVKAVMAISTPAAHHSLVIVAVEPYLDRSCALDLYAKAVVCSGEKVLRTAELAFRSCLSKVTHEQFSEHILPAMERGVKRNPEVLIGCLSSLFASLTIDLSKYVEETILPIVLPFVKDTKEGMRDSAVSAIESLSRQCTDGEVMVKVGTALTGLLNGSKGPLSLWNQRVAAASAIGHIAHSPVAEKYRKELEGVATPVLTQFALKETNEAGKSGLLKVVSTLVRIARCCSVDVLKGYGEAISKEKGRGLFLNSLVDISRGLEDLTQLLDVAPTLIKCVEDSFKKPQLRGDGLASLAVLLRAGPADTRIDELITQKNIVSRVLEESSHVLTVLVGHTVGVQEHIAQADACYLLLTNYREEVVKVEGAEGLIYKSIVYAIASHQNPVSSHSISLVEKMRSVDPYVVDNILNALDNIIEDEDAPAIPRDCISRAVLGTISTSPEPSLLPRLFLTANHPEVIGMGHPQHLWKKIEKRYKQKKVDIGKVMSSLASKYVDKVLGETGLKSDKEHLRARALNCVKLSAMILPQIAFKEFLPRSVPSEAVAAISDREIGIYKTPEGQVYREDAEVYVPQTVEDRNQRRLKSQKGLYSAEDEEWEAQLRKELEEKKKASASASSAGAGAGAGGKSGGRGRGRGRGRGEAKLSPAEEQKKEIERKQLAQEAEIRQNVRAVVNEATLALQVIQALTTNPDTVSDHIRIILPILLSLAPHYRLIEQVQPTLAIVIDCIEAKARSASFLLTRALFQVAAHPGSRNAHAAAKYEAVEKATEKVAMIVGPPEEASPLNPYSFFAVFPVLSCAVMEMEDLALHEKVVTLIATHSGAAAQSDVFPRVDMISTLVRAMERDARLLSPASSAMMWMAEGLNNDELAPFLDGLLSDQSPVRASVLKGLKIVLHRTIEDSTKLSSLLWVAKYDDQNAELAAEVWSLYGRKLAAQYASELIPCLANKDDHVRACVGKAIAGGMKAVADSTRDTLSRLFEFFKQSKPHQGRAGGSTSMIRPVRGNAAQVEDDTFEGRIGVAHSLEASTPCLTPVELPLLFTFMIQHALGDENERVRDQIGKAGLAVINELGKDNIQLLLPLFENYLAEPSNDEVHDRIRVGVVVFLGGLARHLPPEDPKVMGVMNNLLEALYTPAESVQHAVSQVIHPLGKALQPEAGKLVTLLLERLLTGETYGDRRGAAHGLAGLVKGLGISSLKVHDIMGTLQKAVEDKKKPIGRQGALMAFECLCEMLGRLFEPYVIHILPLLLICFGDGNYEVREATEGAARAIMGNLTGHGVKMVLPSLLKALDDRAWRTKQGSIELLGAMAYCAPKQLASCLPTIVPHLTQVMTDTHQKVQQSAKEALNQIGSVIRNPEIQLLVPVLLKALSDPQEGTKPALDALVETAFVHLIDAPSLALVMPIVQRGLKERATDTKKRAAQIAGNMCSLLASQKDVLPYLQGLLPDLRQVLTDPIPEARSVASKAIGSLMTGIGEENFGDLIPWLTDMLKSDTTVERSGGAQGLSEVLAAVGIDRLDDILPDILRHCNHDNPNVREGHVGLFVYLPGAFGAEFQEYVVKILPSVLKGLADEAELVREVALRAGRVLINQYANTSLLRTTFLPVLETEVFHDNWRIRQSSVELLGDMLHRVAGIRHVYADDEEYTDEGVSTEAQGKAIAKALGEERHRSILAALYMLRSDTNTIVRQASLQVWKSIVNNTPRTLKDILPTLIKTLISCLASESNDKRQVAGRSLGDLVRKLGERVLPEIVPILQDGLNSPEDDTREGVCLGLSEVIACAGKAHVATYIQELIPAVKTALCDPSADVREAAAVAFNELQKNAGQRAIEEVLPALLAQLDDSKPEQSANALHGLRQVLGQRASQILPFLIPKLVAPPLTAANAAAIGGVAEVTSSSIHYHLGAILPPLLEGMANSDESMAQSAHTAAKSVVLSVITDGVHLLVADLLKYSQSEDKQERMGATVLMGDFSAESKADYAEHIPHMLHALLRMFDDEDPAIQKAGWTSLGTLTKTFKKENLIQYIHPVQSSISSISAPHLRTDKEWVMPGFCLDKGLGPILPIFLQGLMFGSAETREESAKTIGTLIKLTTTAALKPFVVQITGPLIRIIGDRFPWEVKAAILKTLNLLLSKGGIMLKPFLPQLQTTFVKSLHDNASVVREEAATALAKLMTLKPRVDPLVTELNNSCNSDHTEPGVKEAVLQALQGVLVSGATISPALLENLLTSLTSSLGDESEGVREAAAKCVGAYATTMDDDTFSSFLSEHIMSSDASATWFLRSGKANAVAHLLVSVPSKMEDHVNQVVELVGEGMKDEKVPLREAAIRSIGNLVTVEPLMSHPSASDTIPLLVMGLKDSSSDVKRASFVAVKQYAKLQHDQLIQHLPSLLPPMMASVKEKNIPTKLAAERAMLHSLQIKKSSAVLNDLQGKVKDEVYQNLQQYCTRVLSKLKEDSDEEDE